MVTTLMVLKCQQITLIQLYEQSKSRNAELRQQVQELRVQMNFVLPFMDIKIVAAGIKNNHTYHAQRSSNEHQQNRTEHQVILRNGKIECFEEQQITE